MPKKIGGTSGNDKRYGTDEDDVIYGFDGNDLLWGEGGNDLLYGGHGHDLLVGGDGNDLLFGDLGNDWLVGNAGDDLLRGGPGADGLDGGSGVDTASYQHSPAGVSVSLLTDSAAGGDAQGDELDNIENLIGSSHSDYLAGNDQNNTIEGGGDNDMLLGFGGHDTLSGDSGNDQLYGGDGFDELRGGLGNDKLFGGDGFDHLIGGAGGDLLNGGPSSDIADYSASFAAVTIDMSVNLASGGDAQGDTLVDIESLFGSENDDSLAGHGGDNVLVGAGGGDVLKGYDGNDYLYGDYLGPDQGASGDDTLYGGNGDDHLAGGAGNDALYGGIGSDSLGGGAGSDQLHGGDGIDEARYSSSDAGVTIDLALGVGKGGDAQGDVLTGIENIWGSLHDDVLIGNDVANRLAGSAGVDTLAGNGGADIFSFGVASSGLGSDADRILDFSQKDGDRIELDTSPHVPGPDLIFIGGQAFSGAAGELRYEQDGKNTWVSVDLDGDAGADLQIKCVGTIDFTANDFIL